MTPPLRIGSYEVVRELGRGSMGVVYEARHAALGRAVALKRLTLCDGSTLQRFKAEAELLARFEHPGVVRIHEFGADAQGPFVVMDLIEGVDLERAFRGRPAGVAQALAIARRLCDAVEALHAVGVIHRDLKPDNVLLRPDGTPVLVDFGLARDLSATRLTQTGAILGTPCYMAPEQALGERGTSARTDVYGLGAILYFLLCGEPPIRAGGTLATLHAVVSQPLTWPAGVALPAGLRQACSQALAKDPEDRFASAAAFAQALLEGDGGEPRRRRALAGTVAAALALAALSAGLAVALNREGAPDPAPPAPAAASPPPAVEPREAPLPAERLPWLHVAEEGPPPRSAHAMTCSGEAGAAVLFGGRDAAGRALSDTWVWNGARWTPEAQTPQARMFVPTARYAHAMAQDRRAGFVVVVGGKDEEGVALADMALWKNGKWNAKSGWRGLPEGRSEHALTRGLRARLALFGGRRPDGAVCADLFRFDGLDWERVIAGGGPPARARAAFCCHAPTDTLLLYGGVSDAGDPLGDTWLWDGEAWRAHAGASPPPRHGATLTPYGGSLLLFGGLGADDAPCRDPWLWDGEAWRALAPGDPASTPSGRDHACCWEPSREQLVLFGGLGAAAPGGELRALRSTWISRAPRR